jgi:DNA-binding response OmpR family regulator
MQLLKTRPMFQRESAITRTSKLSRIHVVEDDPDIVNLLEFNLRAEGYRVSSSRDGNEGLQAILRDRPNMVVLDIMLPGLGGLEICRRLRSDAAMAQVPIIMISVKGMEHDIVVGLGIGADDYITKPFSINELIARVKSLQRRTENRLTDNIPAPLSARGLHIDPMRQQVSVNGSPVKVTNAEFKLLYTLAAQPGRVFTRELLKLHACGDDVEVLDHNIDVHVASVRRKLGDERALIETVWGVGYRFAEV